MQQKGTKFTFIKVATAEVVELQQLGYRVKKHLGNSHLGFRT